MLSRFLLILWLRITCPNCILPRLYLSRNEINTVGMKIRKCFLVLFVSTSTFAQSISIANMEKGVAHFSKGNFDSAIVCFNTCIQEAKKEGNNKLVSNAYNNLGNCYANTGNPIKAVAHYQSAIRIAEKERDTLRLAKTLKNIGTVYSEQKDFKMALQYYDKALILARNTKDSSLIADCYNNQGVVYEQQNKFNQAAQIYAKALAIYKAEKNRERISMSLNNLGIVNKNLGNYSASIDNYSEALKIAVESADKFMVAAALNNLGGIYLLTEQYMQALELFNQALDTAKKIGATEIIIENYDGIAAVYEGQKQFQKALVYRKLYESEKSKFINIQRSGQLAEMQIKYETEKKESEIKLLRQKEQIKNMEIAEQKLALQKQYYVLVSTLLVLLAFFTGWYFWYSRKQLKNKLEHEIAIKETEEKERIRIAKDIHDDLGSGLSKINFLSALITKKAIGSPEIKSNSEAVSETARKMVENMRDLIWALNPENTTLSVLVSRVREYASDYLEDFPIDLKTNFPDSVPETSISKESHRAIFMVVKECLNNCVKHSFATEIFFQIRLTKEALLLTIKDNGVGFQLSNDTTGNGLRNMKNRIASIGGSMNVQSNPTRGTQIEMSILILKM